MPDPDPATAIRIRDTCVGLHLHRAVRTVTRTYDEALRPLGLTLGQFSLLVTLLAPKPQSIGQIATALALDRTTLTANLKPLERRGLVVSAADPNDGRSRLLRPTDEGRALVRRAIPLWEEAQATYAATTPDLDTLRAQLRQLAFPD